MRVVIWGLLGLLLVASPQLAQAQADYPSRPVELIVAFAPGGPADTAIRIIQPALATALGVAAVPVTKAGAGGALAMDFVAKARPDGYTVAVTTNSTVSILPAMRSDLGYKLDSFEAVGTWAVDSQALLVKPGGQYKTFDEFVEYARKTPGKLTYGSPGLGTVSFFNMEIVKASLGIDVQHVPFTGSGPVKNAILGGHVDVAASALSPLLSAVRAGELVPLVTTATRPLPGISAPHLAEKGAPEASLSTFMQLYVPAKTPREIVAKLTRALETAAKSPAVAQAMERAGLQVDFRDGETTRKMMEVESQAVAKVVRKLNLAK